MLIAVITAAELARLMSTPCESESSVNYERNVTTIYKCVEPSKDTELVAPKHGPKKEGKK